MITGIRLEADLQSKQVQFMIGRLAYQISLMNDMLRAGITAKEDPKERLALEAQYDSHMALADDPGKVLAFIRDNPELLPESMR